MGDKLRGLKVCVAVNVFSEWAHEGSVDGLVRSAWVKGSSVGSVVLVKASTMVTRRRTVANITGEHRSENVGQRPPRVAQTWQPSDA